MEIKIVELKTAPNRARMSRIITILQQLFKVEVLEADVLDCILDDRSRFLVALAVYAEPDDEVKTGEYVGVATVVEMHTAHGIVGYVHDVVVDSAVRGQGVGSLIMQRVDEIEIELKCRESNLTTNQVTRPAAARVYEKHDYVAKPTSTFYVKRFAQPS